jgi:hypothetical protein
MYKLIKHFENISVMESVLRLEDKTYIPFDPANTDYQAYLKWIAEGNTPDPAEEQA